MPKHVCRGSIRCEHVAASIRYRKPAGESVGQSAKFALCDLILLMGHLLRPTSTLPSFRRTSPRLKLSQVPATGKTGKLSLEPFCVFAYFVPLEEVVRSFRYHHGFSVFVR